MDRSASLREIVRRVVEVAQPQRIILFGSAARGEMGPHSDFDLLVIKGGPVHRRRLAQQIRRRLCGVGHAVDLIVATPEDIARYGQSPYLIYRSALREGKALYDSSEAVPAR
jgi:predicted nucleotidyltransferase